MLEVILTSFIEGHATDATCRHRILFKTTDLSQVKAYCQRQWSRLLANKVSAQDFIIAKAVKLGTYA